MEKFHPIKIGTLSLKNNLIAAPMAGLSALPYRVLAMEMGCALAMSEMVSAEGTIRAGEKTKRYFKNDESVRPFGLQVFGANPESIGKSIEMLSSEPVDLFDINMGCPVHKVCKKGAGAALMKNPELVSKIVAAARKATEKPLTIKIRAGWNSKSINCIEIAKIAESCGADAVAIHARTREQEFSGKADWSHIAAVKSALKIPVIGNGDIKSRHDALEMIEQTRCDAIMIGRAAIGNPWIFRAILDSDFSEPGRKERLLTATRHLEMLREFLGEHSAALAMRSIISWYTKGIPGVKEFMRNIQRSKGTAEMKSLIDQFAANI
ncbi:MAG TPA: tRNA dihydrouridine synthase DusB [bacterium]|nr:tRNA dihydrouridine synthase DusB [Myxococcales bacterium]OQA61609.1 MAG: tRNA-dihydrouridine synthase C [bacterium ADurb.Bin270]HPW45855.1 tRNA dihydrouridine synthase DusB [bacterium]HQC50652.1 tRNA dihydrouridine synthase DusB [bacterium]